MTGNADHDLEFSSNRLLIADPLKAEIFATDLKTRNLKILCQPVDKELGQLSSAEKMIFTDFLYNIGGDK